MKKNLLLLLFGLFCLVAQAQTVVVPDNIYFADQHLIINEDARKAIQKQVDGLLKYPQYFQAKVDRADAYFPIISRIFAEEGLPDDFKYLVLQESGLVSDAISTSNAVGFWQFKKEAAADHGLLITPDVDERKHIVNSSRGAAKYLVKSNSIYYKNWFNTLLSYYLGFTGAKSHAKSDHTGSKEMEVTGKTNWYILTFLAHKVAFENFIGKNPSPPIVLQEVPVTVGQSLSDVALATQTDYAEIQKYNKWLSGSVVPGNKPYTVLVPVTNVNQQQVVLAANKAGIPAASPIKSSSLPGPAILKKHNGLKAIVARQGDSIDNLAKAGKVSSKRFRQYNDLGSHDAVIAGETYYLERKGSKASTAYYAVQEGEQTWNVAQKFGVKVKSLLWYNRLRKNERLLAGRVMWLQQRRPSHVPVEYQEVKPSAPTPQPQTPEKPLIIAKNEPKVAPQKSSAPVSKPAPKNTVEDKLANIFGVKPDPEKVAKVDTQPVEVDENLTEVNEEADDTEPVATAPVVPNAGSKAETGITSKNDSIQESENQASSSSDVAQVSDSEDDVIVDSTLASEESQEEVAQNTEPKNQNLYPNRKGTSTNDSVLLDSESIATASETSDTVNSKEKVNITPSGTIANTVSVTITEHVVTKGETLYSISRLYDIPVNQLQTWNNLSTLGLAIGQNLRLTPPTDTPVQSVSVVTKPIVTVASMPPVTERATTANAVTTQHVVSAGESMYQISRKYGVTIKEIMDWNNKSDFSVAPGEKLTIKPKSSSRK
ncbi:LysM peptidoglycan-binding domain-containing protein [Adhaeribacter radiodurans]|uniref:LysM peptidoglycan-binding domain-containing protein n=1 Tax=Adhaeribacter radiodurans TaxID=2745197 RepID=A0A7L7L4B0_9BACT|nr:LysM peptidoglycan-binding domain-containing protein [Adhaeribacter radiodurans]QMU27651.1 LysM peptidoglycan-binding domain-containing protein [Adhaeribacter radiodurans]